ncbi:putative MFS family arabinose efflux permease [Humibacillus xanthopallidus]|uniref:Putative MFS family arabinose efflux permease n=1 Tax=Humibacillus xanthopallidus TaxID=412689 RepID=A0A543PW27_9MICO|nr:MFS transporter [Humibacillus xanthopallidus]TQN48240.1 putative MFS family arabinose efflux permease [Humibacillus xanthopallidus]
MDVGQYRHVLAIRDTRNALALGLLIRIPMFAGTVLLTLHVVTALGRSYGQAGLVTAAATIAIAISGPWRGRLLDRQGLRRTVAPSLLIQLVCWSIAPWVGYAPLMALAALAGLFVVPTFSILRQVIIRSVPEHQRRTALSLDSAATELSFMAGPALGVWLATTWNTGWALFTVEMAAVLAGCVLWVANPAIKAAPDVPDPTRDDTESADAIEGAADPEPVPGAWRGFITVRVAAVYLAAACTTLVLSGTDVSIVAALRSFEATASIGWILALWGAGSLVGGLVYGAWHRSFSVFWLLGGLAATTAPVALAVGVPSFAVLVTLSGFLCAPTITATVEQLSRVVPERFRGEMMGWHGSAMTAGSAVGAPLAGFAIDHGGWRWGFLVVSALGVLVAGAGMLGGARGRAHSPEQAPSKASPARTAADSEPGVPAAIVEH